MRDEGGRMKVRREGGSGGGVWGQSTDKRSGIVNTPNNLEDEQYIVRLTGQVVPVSLEMVAVVKSLPGLRGE
jgi:hypothetical protein